jgi:uncharacterized membrane protein
VNQIEKHGSHYGILYGIAAYGSWGIFPLYFKTVASVPPVEVLAHRALWSFVMLAVLVGLLGRWKEVWRELHSRKLLLMLALSTLLIAANWLMFIYAVTSGQVLRACGASPLMGFLAKAGHRGRLNREAGCGVGSRLCRPPLHFPFASNPTVKPIAGSLGHVPTQQVAHQPRRLPTSLALGSCRFVI